jgi:histone acetyltransferase (RNA polymerase elongator complex component)
MTAKNNSPTKAKPTPKPTRTVKISDILHHKIRVLSVQKRMPMQEFIEGILTHGLREKVYDKFETQKEALAA